MSREVNNTFDIHMCAWRIQTLCRATSDHNLDHNHDLPVTLQDGIVVLRSITGLSVLHNESPPRTGDYFPHSP